MLQLLCVQLLYGFPHPLLSLASVSFSCHPVIFLLSLSLSQTFFISSFLLVKKRKKRKQCCRDWLLCPVCRFMPIFLPPATHFPACATPFRPVSFIYLFPPPNHFAPVVFEGAVGVAGDKEVHLPRQEQPGGTS